MATLGRPSAATASERATSAVPTEPMELKVSGKPPSIEESTGEALRAVNAAIDRAARRDARDLADALDRERALRMVLEAVMTSLRPKGLRRRRFREQIAKLERGNFGDAPPEYLRDALLREAERVLRAER
ncbi:hypothetical protein [Methylobacterium sp. 285MFTsu5.1]|uniref:hypothetical protein n=1 Tax=Methylobacterium sp. 285MFTsu5.1 TaxID=1172187 RepID=UPI001319C954|nr:hypothetical protein [Methylobacterium sp. 285MFTsu5.1]